LQPHDMENTKVIL